MKLFSIIIFLLLTDVIQAQECDYFPADCPQTGDIESAQDSDACIRNLILPQEITMQNDLRRLIGSMMEEVAGKTKWTVYEFTESPGGGIGTDGNTKPLPYSLRPPYKYSISFDFIVNQDSLHAWQYWYNNDLRRKSDEVVESYKQTDNSGEQSYADSAMYYGNLMGKYSNDHAAEYQKAILNNDSKYLKKHDEDIKRFQDKIEKFTAKANGKRDENFSDANSKNEDLQSYKKRKTNAYRNASTLRVSFVFNENITASLSRDIKIMKPLSVPHVSFAALFHNADPDQTQLASSFLTNPDFAFLLFGKWSTKPDQYNCYQAAYFQVKPAHDDVSEKKIPCDKVQTIMIGIEGNPKYIDQFLQLPDIQKLNDLIVKE